MGSAIGFSDGGLLSGLGADTVKKYHLISLIGLHHILIHHLTELDVLAILFLLLTSMQPQSCPHLDLDLIIVHIPIRDYLSRMLFLFMTLKGIC